MPTGRGYVSSLEGIPPKNGFYKFCFMNCKLGNWAKGLTVPGAGRALAGGGETMCFFLGGCCIDVQRYQTL